MDGARVPQADFQQTVHHEAERGGLRPAALVCWGAGSPGQPQRFSGPSFDVFQPVATRARRGGVQVMRCTFHHRNRRRG